jgi:hypothetical protein
MGEEGGWGPICVSQTVTNSSSFHGLVLENTTGGARHLVLNIFLGFSGVNAVRACAARGTPFPLWAAARFTRTSGPICSHLHLFRACRCIVEHFHSRSNSGGMCNAGVSMASAQVRESGGCC